MKHIFIINPRAGKEKENISVRVRQYVDSRPDLETLVFNTEYVGHETELVKRLCHIFEDEMIRLYVCGGGGSLCRVISGITNFSMVEVAFHPCGMNNDFLNVFEGDTAAFKNLTSLVNGTPMYMDLLDFGLGRALNSCSVGYSAKISSDVNNLARYNFGGTKAPYYLSIARNTLVLISSHYDILADKQDFSGHYTLISAFNGISYGGYYSPLQKASPLDGKMNLLMYELPSWFGEFAAIRHFRKGELDKLGKNVKLVACTEMNLKMPESRKMYFSADGEVFDMSSAKNQVAIRVMPAMLKFVLPAGVALKEQCREGE